jgi:hypothetical protein
VELCSHVGSYVACTVNARYPNRSVRVCVCGSRAQGQRRIHVQAPASKLAASFWEDTRVIESVIQPGGLEYRACSGAPEYLIPEFVLQQHRAQSGPGSFQFQSAVPATDTIVCCFDRYLTWPSGDDGFSQTNLPKLHRIVPAANQQLGIHK